MSELGKRSAHARRLYHHHINGGKLTDRDVGKMVEYIEELERKLDAALRREEGDG